ncbi:MAG: T9SS type A sorting domain-containing protein [Bacteroidetes bacterium]|nr:MAG: T9SS type A sorting domain-containing protein [Bacteroidota bacterium]
MSFLRNLTFLFFLLHAMVSPAQFLANFSAIQQNDKIELNIVIAGGNICNGINVLRSTDGVYFNPIGDIAGICGSSTEDVFYSYTDTNPVPNAVNYYKLDLITLGYTSTINIRYIYFGNNQLLLYPNPLVHTASVYLQTTNADISSYRINDRFGRILREVEGVRGNFFELRRDDLPRGLYYLEVRTGSRESVVKAFFVD